VESVGNEKGELVGARITIHRKDWQQPFVWEVAFSEYNKNQGLWKTMPEFMIKKIAIGQGFRLAFPNELGGMPYLQEEMEDITPPKPSMAPPQAKSQPKREPKPQQAEPTDAQGEAQQIVAKDTLTVKATILKITSKEGSKGGKKWTLYGILADGVWYNTFDKKLFEIAIAKTGQEVEIEYTEGEKGKNLVAIKWEGCTGNPATCDLSTWENDKPSCSEGKSCLFEAEKTCEEPW
jgi:hypothetical protein